MSVSRALRRTFGRQLQFAVPWIRLTHHRRSPLFANRFPPLIRPRVASSDAEKPGCHLELSRTLKPPVHSRMPIRIQQILSNLGQGRFLCKRK